MSGDIPTRFPKLNLPPADLKLRHIENGRMEVFDRWRGRWVALTPEEWVRQHFVTMMVATKGYMSGRIANEISLSLNSMSRRCDTVVYDDSMHPVMIVEYKAPDVRISQAVFEQIARYSMVLRAPYLVVSNGLVHYCCRVDYKTGSCSFLSELPDYSSIV